MEEFVRGKHCFDEKRCGSSRMAHEQGLKVVKRDTVLESYFFGTEVVPKKLKKEKNK